MINTGAASTTVIVNVCQQLADKFGEPPLNERRGVHVPHKRPGLRVSISWGWGCGSVWPGLGGGLGGGGGGCGRGGWARLGGVLVRLVGGVRGAAVLPGGGLARSGWWVGRRVRVLWVGWGVVSVCLAFS